MQDFHDGAFNKADLDQPALEFAARQAAPGQALGQPLAADRGDDAPQAARAPTQLNNVAIDRALANTTPFTRECSNHDQPSEKRIYPRMTINIGLKDGACKAVHRRALDPSGGGFTYRRAAAPRRTHSRIGDRA
jgi:hypothetical protein